jgi:hypothetical protein
MDPRSNPYAPGAGSPPPDLAGRDDLLERVAIALDRIRQGLAAKSVLLVGLRGVGKTVLLNRIRNDADARGFVTIFIEAPEKRSLPAILAGPLRAALLKLDRLAAGGDLAKRGLRALGGFIDAMKIRFGDVEFGVDLGSEPGVADTGDLEHDLADLLATVAAAARERKTALVLFVDELQYVEEDQLAALITALHRCAQQSLPVTLVGAGLPQLIGQTGRAKSYAERLFDFPEVGPLAPDAARQALQAPAARHGVEYTDAALDEILRQTQAYPYFIQEWGQALLAVRRHLADPAVPCRPGHRERDRGTRHQLLPRSPRPADAVGKALPPRDGRTGPGTASLRRHRRQAGRESAGGRAGARDADRQGHGVQPRVRRHRVHGAAVRPFHAPRNAVAVASCAEATSITCRSSPGNAPDAPGRRRSCRAVSPP